MDHLEFYLLNYFKAGLGQQTFNLTEVILRHGGEAQGESDAFAALSDADRNDLLEFLNSLILFPPDDTSSNLDPANPARRERVAI